MSIAVVVVVAVGGGVDGDVGTASVDIDVDVDDDATRSGSVVSEGVDREPPSFVLTILIFPPVCVG